MKTLVYRIGKNIYMLSHLLNFYNQNEVKTVEQCLILVQKNYRMPVGNSNDMLLVNLKCNIFARFFIYIINFYKFSLIKFK